MTRCPNIPPISPTTRCYTADKFSETSGEVCESYSPSLDHGPAEWPCGSGRYLFKVRTYFPCRQTLGSGVAQRIIMDRLRGSPEYGFKTVWP